VVHPGGRGAAGGRDSDSDVMLRRAADSGQGWPTRDVPTAVGNWPPRHAEETCSAPARRGALSEGFAAWAAVQWSRDQESPRLSGRAASTVPVPATRRPLAFP
jgi:hypothetical protein